MQIANQHYKYSLKITDTVQVRHTEWQHVARYLHCQQYVRKAFHSHFRWENVLPLKGIFEYMGRKAEAFGLCHKGATCLCSPQCDSWFSYLLGWKSVL